MSSDDEHPAARQRQRVEQPAAGGQGLLSLLELLARAAPLRTCLVASGGAAAELGICCRLGAETIVSLDILQRLHTGGAHAALISSLWDDLAQQVPDPLPDLPHRLGPGGAEKLKVVQLRAICREAGVRGAGRTKAAMRVRPQPAGCLSWALISPCHAARRPGAACCQSASTHQGALHCCACCLQDKLQLPEHVPLRVYIECAKQSNIAVTAMMTAERAKQAFKLRERQMRVRCSCPRVWACCLRAASLLLPDA